MCVDDRSYQAQHGTAACLEATDRLYSSRSHFADRFLLFPGCQAFSTKSMISSEWPKSDVLPDGIKYKVRQQLAGKTCWVCETGNARIAPAMSEGDKQVSGYVPNPR
ncbi:hypothetical protein BDV36DRAFT_249568, partial [Aspergillus pseudocaelatus]